MAIDLNPLDGDDSIGVNDVLDAAGNAVEAVADVVTPDLTVELPDASAPEPAPELANDGFYQSLPGVDSVVGVELDQTYELIEQIDTLGEETFGAEAWAQAGVAAEAAQYGQDQQTPADLELEFARADSQSQRDLWAWQDDQAAQSAADAAAHEAQQASWDAWRASGVLNDPNRPEQTPPAG